MTDRLPDRGTYWYIGALIAASATIVADAWIDLDYRLLANVALVAMAGLVTTFAVLYAGWSAWSANRIGKIYLIKSVCLALVLDQIVLATWWDTDFPGRQYFRFAIYSLGAAVYVPMLVSLWQEQRRDKLWQEQRLDRRGGPPSIPPLKVNREPS